MRRADVRIVLDRESVDPSSYSLDGGLPFEAYVIDREASGWVTYYSERGLRTGERVFADESDACEDLVAQILRDPTTRWRA